MRIHKTGLFMSLQDSCGRSLNHIVVGTLYKAKARVWGWELPARHEEPHIDRPIDRKLENWSSQS